MAGNPESQFFCGRTESPSEQRNGKDDLERESQLSRMESCTPSTDSPSEGLFNDGEINDLHYGEIDCGATKSDAYGKDSFDDEVAVNGLGREARFRYSNDELLELWEASVTSEASWNDAIAALDAVVDEMYEMQALPDAKFQRRRSKNSERRQRYKARREAMLALSQYNQENEDDDRPDSIDESGAYFSASRRKGLFNIPFNARSRSYDNYGYVESFQPQAFAVEGEPDFESGDPEDGFEYLRRVIWEAARCPKVVVAEIDPEKLVSEQTPYMPEIPAIQSCPPGALPSKEWEKMFAESFYELREEVSKLYAPVTSSPEVLPSVWNESAWELFCFGEITSTQSEDFEMKETVEVVTSGSAVTFADSDELVVPLDSISTVNPSAESPTGPEEQPVTLKFSGSAERPAAKCCSDSEEQLVTVTSVPTGSPSAKSSGDQEVTLVNVVDIVAADKPPTVLSAYPGEPVVMSDNVLADFPSSEPDDPLVTLECVSAEDPSAEFSAARLADNASAESLEPQVTLESVSIYNPSAVSFIADGEAISDSFINLPMDESLQWAEFPSSEPDDPLVTLECVSAEDPSAEFSAARLEPFVTLDYISADNASAESLEPQVTLESVSIYNPSAVSVIADGEAISDSFSNLPMDESLQAHPLTVEDPPDVLDDRSHEVESFEVFNRKNILEDSEDESLECISDIDSSVQLLFEKVFMVARAWELPLIHIVLRLDLVSRAALFRYHVRWLDSVDSLTQDRALWLLGLAAVVDAPLNADTTAAFRAMLRYCAGVRASKGDLSEAETLMLNALITVAGVCFGQAETGLT